MQPNQDQVIHQLVFIYNYNTVKFLAMHCHLAVTFVTLIDSDPQSEAKKILSTFPDSQGNREGLTTWLRFHYEYNCLLMFTNPLYIIKDDLANYWQLQDHLVYRGKSFSGRKLLLQLFPATLPSFVPCNMLENKIQLFHPLSNSCVP